MSAKTSGSHRVCKNVPKIVCQLTSTSQEVCKICHQAVNLRLRSDSESARRLQRKSLFAFFSESFIKLDLGAVFKNGVKIKDERMFLFSKAVCMYCASCGSPDYEILVNAMPNNPIDQQQPRHEACCVLSHDSHACTLTQEEPEHEEEQQSMDTA